MFLMRLSEVLEVRQSPQCIGVGILPMSSCFHFLVLCRFSVCFDFHISFHTRWVNVFVSFSLFLFVVIRFSRLLLKIWLGTRWIIFICCVSVATFANSSGVECLRCVYCNVVPFSFASLCYPHSFALFLYKRNDPLWLRNCVHFLFWPAAIQPAHCALREYQHERARAHKLPFRTWSQHTVDMHLARWGRMVECARVSVSVSEWIGRWAYERTRATDRVCLEYNTSGRKETHQTNDGERMDKLK